MIIELNSLVHQLMKKKSILRFLLMALPALLCCCSRQGGRSSATTADDSTSVVDTATLVMKVSRTSRLYTAEYKVHKIVTHEDVKHLKATLLGQEYDTKLSLGERKVAIPIDVTLKAYIDFSSFHERQIERSPDGRTLHVILPDPKVIVTSSKIDHASTRQYTALLRSDFSDAELKEFTRQGVESVLRAVPQMGILETARQSAAATLIPIFSALGYEPEQIVVTFRKEFTERDLPFYYENIERLKN